MANAKRDDNNVPTITGVLNTDGESIVPVKVKSDNNSLAIDNNSTGSDNGPGPRALRDENFVTTLIGVSSVDGVTPVAVYVDSDGNLLIDGS